MNAVTPGGQEPLILVGYWRRDSEPGWPDPVDFVDGAWDPAERQKVAEYLTRGFQARAYRGYSWCRFCEEDNGFQELSDGVYVWPEGLAHYLTDHEVRLPEPFVAHVLSMDEAFEILPYNESWWRSQTGPSRR
jgi:hypothetical protein